MTLTQPAGSPAFIEPDFSQSEFPFTPLDFTRIAEIMATDCGIVLEPAKMPLVYSRLTKRLRLLRVRTFRQYCALISSDGGSDERRKMVETLTTNITQFFREKHHFDHLRQAVLPHLLEEARRGGRVRLWSAGCSSGEEAYSIGLMILDLMPDAARFDIRVLGTDIDTQVLALAKAGRYPKAAVAAIEPGLLESWMHFRQAGEGAPCWEVGDQLRSLVAFRSANLVAEPWPMRGPFQVIFCRNVVIYFDADTRQRVLGRLVNLLSPAGHIYIGHAERLPSDAVDLSVVGLTTYRRVTTGAVRPNPGSRGPYDIRKEHG
jgi:chemotaxis protein methyltransferase CheR